MKYPSLRFVGTSALALAAVLGGLATPAHAQTTGLKPELPKSDDPRKLGIVPGFNDGTIR